MDIRCDHLSNKNTNQLLAFKIINKKHSLRQTKAQGRIETKIVAT
ncbi:hypothetical protein RINTHM_10900 [Richelia intracellularis HM01]|nr:hypothetical protein RINTHM_10900 [Richelia intracellularis HM01]